MIVVVPTRSGMTSCRAAPEFEPNWKSPEYVAVRTFWPGDEDTRKHVAVAVLPLPEMATGFGLHRPPAASLTVIVPVGVPGLPSVLITLIDTWYDWPTVLGSGVSAVMIVATGRGWFTTIVTS